MNIEVSYYGVLTEITGCQVEVIETEESVSIERFAELLKAKHKGISIYPLMLSLNSQLCSSETKLNEGDKIDCMPPFSGG